MASLFYLASDHYQLLQRLPLQTQIRIPPRSKICKPSALKFYMLLFYKPRLLTWCPQHHWLLSACHWKRSSLASLVVFHCLCEILRSDLETILVLNFKYFFLFKLRLFFRFYEGATQEYFFYKIELIFVLVPYLIAPVHCSPIPSWAMVRAVHATLVGWLANWVIRVAPVARI